MRVQKISSLANALMKRAVALKEKKYRKEYQACLVEGAHAIATCAQAGWKLENLLVTDNFIDNAHQIHAEQVYIISDSLMKKISSATTPSGIIAIFKLPTVPDPQYMSAGIVIAQLQDPGNVGTLIRTTAALGLKTVVLVESVDPWSPKVIQSTAGTMALVDIYQLSWQELLAYKNSIKLCALVVSGGKSANKLDMRNKLLVVGNEAHGLPQAWQKQCDELITLPMPGGTESLNAAVAGSIALYVAYFNS